MFRSLRLKLTLINVTVVGLIFLIFLAGIYFAMVRSITIQSDQAMRNVANDISNGNQRLSNARERRFIRTFYVVADQSGKITEISPNLPFDRSEAERISQNAFNDPHPRGRVSDKEDTYRYIKMPDNRDPGKTILVFADAGQEKEMIGHLFFALSVTGFIVLALVFFGSLFMANRALIPIKNAWQRQRNFVADASHELRTPLAVIQTNLELVLDNPKESVESQSKWLDNIQAENKRMAKLVDDLLFLARADSEQELLEMNFFDLPLALKEALTPLEPLAQSKGITLESDLLPHLQYCGDETRLKQLAVILVDNAIKYTASGGRVKLEMKNDDNNEIITVTDTGEGISSEHLHKIFERFYRIDKARSRGNGGTGLGLAIAEWIVREHHGTIKAASSPGSGTVFTVNLPLTHK